MSRKISRRATCWYSMHYKRSRFAAQNVTFRRAICGLLKGNLPPFGNWEIVIWLTTVCRDARLVCPPERKRQCYRCREWRFADARAVRPYGRMGVDVGLGGDVGLAERVGRRAGYACFLYVIAAIMQNRRAKEASAAYCTQRSARPAPLR